MRKVGLTGHKQMPSNITNHGELSSYRTVPVTNGRQIEQGGPEEEGQQTEELHRTRIVGASTVCSGQRKRDRELHQSPHDTVIKDAESDVLEEFSLVCQS